MLAGTENGDDIDNQKYLCDFFKFLTFNQLNNFWFKVKLAFVFYDENSTQFQYLVKSAEHRVRHVIVDHDGRDEHFVEIDSVGPYCLVDGIGRVVIGRCWTAARRTRVRSIRPQYKETSKSTRIVRPSAVSFKSVETHNQKSGEPPKRKKKKS